MAVNKDTVRADMLNITSVWPHQNQFSSAYQ